MWDYKNADSMNIRRSHSSVNWARYCIQSTFSNYCPSKVVTCRHKDAPRMTSEIKQELKEKTKIYRKYVKNKYTISNKQLLNEKMIETNTSQHNIKIILL